jgi:hypothetical protein
MVPTAFVENLIKENCELACIIGVSIRTAQAKVSQITNKQYPIANTQCLPLILDTKVRFGNSASP